MFSQSDKAWVSALVALVGQYLTSKLGWSFITPELVAAIAGIATWFTPNRAAPAVPAPPQPK
jgi:hypothetical protein